VVTPTDTTPPVITVPADITAEATEPGGAHVGYTVTASDDVDGPVSVTCVPASGSLFPIGTTTVNCSASDAAGHTATASFHVAVRDTTGPAFTAPANQTLEATGPSGATATYTTPTASDAVDGPRPVNCTPASGSTFAIGTTTVTCTATDSHSNTTTHTF